jgi:hypothetical protein
MKPSKAFLPAQETLDALLILVSQTAIGLACYLFALNLPLFWDGALFLQGLAFPFSSLARIVKSLTGMDGDAMAVLVTALPVLAIWWALAGLRRQMTWSVGWFGIAALPAVILLDFRYVQEAPRLLYLASAGAAAFWAMPIGLATASRRRGLAQLVIGAIVVVGASLWSYLFIQRRGESYRLMGESIAQLAQLPAQPGCSSRASTLVVNFPEWFFVRDPEYLIGHDGIKTVAENSGLTELVWVNTHRRTLLQPVQLPDIQSADAPFQPYGEPQTLDSLQPLLRSAQAAMVNVTASVVGLYRTGDGARLAARDVRGQPWASNAVVAGQLNLP